MPVRRDGCRIVVVAAVARNGVIGRANGLVWRLGADMRRFRGLTIGHTVLMGRSTFESIGRPLDDRRNVVLSRDPGFRAAGVRVAGSWQDALAEAEGDLYVVGGAAIYALALPVADRIHLTEVECEPAGDTWMPPYDRFLFREVSRERCPAAPGDTCAFSFVDLERGAEASFNLPRTQA